MRTTEARISGIPARTRVVGGTREAGGGPCGKIRTEGGTEGTEGAAGVGGTTVGVVAEAAEPRFNQGEGGGRHHGLVQATARWCVEQ